MFTIVTALRGSPVLSLRWKREFLAQTGNEVVPAVIGVSNAFDTDIAIAIQAQSVPSQPWVGDDETDRINHIAGIVSSLIEQVQTEWTVIWDDDILPPEGALASLIAFPAVAPTDVVGLVTVYPYPDDPKYASPDYRMLFFTPIGTAAHVSSVPQDGVHEVWGGGTGFSIWRTAVLKSLLPLKSPGNGAGWDHDLAWRLFDLGHKTMADCSIVSRHDQLPT